MGKPCTVLLIGEQSLIAFLALINVWTKGITVSYVAVDWLN